MRLRTLSLALMAKRNTWTRDDWANPWFAGALLGALVLAAIDLALGDKLVLLPLLCLPPLAASMGAGVFRTGAVGAVCVVLTLALGAPDDMFGTREHLVDVFTTVAVAAGACWIARVRERLRHAERRSKLIADAGAALQRSLDPDAALGEVARLAVPEVS
jgi:hypothetical protein